MKKFGKSYSTRSKQYRMKRIDVNVKINVLAYSVEMLGGLLLVGLSLLRPPTFLYIGTDEKPPLALAAQLGARVASAADFRPISDFGTVF